MPSIARTTDVIARVRASLALEIPKASDAQKAGDAIEAIVSAVDTIGTGKLSKAEVLAVAAQDADAGAHVARAYELITGRAIDLPGSLASQLPADWRKALKDEIGKPYFRDLEKYVAAERKQFHVEPPADLVFKALERTPLAKVKVVLLGQDPYPTAGNACGLSFSVPKDKPIPASLKNMLDTAHNDVGTSVPNNGDLTPWADQGVLLLNTILTVREGAPDSHKDHGWELFTQAILDKVNDQKKRVVFLLLGRQAQAEGARVDVSKHVVVTAPHPSPMVPHNPFGKTHVFSEVNTALEAGGRARIDWQIPDV